MKWYEDCIQALCFGSRIKIIKLFTFFLGTRVSWKGLYVLLNKKTFANNRTSYFVRKLLLVPILSTLGSWEVFILTVKRTPKRAGKRWSYINQPLKYKLFFFLFPTPTLGSGVKSIEFFAYIIRDEIGSYWRQIHHPRLHIWKSFQKFVRNETHIRNYVHWR